MKTALLMGLGLAGAACGASDAGVPLKEEPMQISPRMAEAAELAGGWTLSGLQGDCRLELLVEEAALEGGSLAAPMQALRSFGPCAIGPALAGWRPIPLGLELTDRAGFAIATFEQVGAAEYRSTDQVWLLRRVA